MSKNKKAKAKPTIEPVQKGTLEITRSGMGYVVVDNKSGDVLVRPGNFNTALHGDKVRVKVTKISSNSKKKEGKITEVINRKQTEFIGHLQLSTNYAFFVPDTEKPMPDFYIPLDKVNGAKNKERVIARLIEWSKENKKPVGEIISTITNERENEIAMKELLTEAGFPIVFSTEVINESEQFLGDITKAEIKKRKDCRELLTFTIDPVDAKDFDDAISIKKIKTGLYEIGVHIADVSHYITPNTLLDDEAYKRATSVYLPDRVNPMLPERISNELCSLKPHEDKLTFSAIFHVNATGEIKDTWIGRTVIHSNHRFTYEEVQEVIESKNGLHKDELLLLNSMAQSLRKERFRKGAINFSSQEVRFKLDENAKPIGIVIKESKEAHQLIEEFMLLANKAIAEYVSKIKVNKNPVPFPYRVHDTPDEDRLQPFIAFAKKHGHEFDLSSPQSIAESFNSMLKDVKGKPEQHVLEQLGIRTMAKAVYTSENIGHYGLAFEHYCHFTSPIRRYPDVLVHRIIDSCIKNKPEIDKKMDLKCKHCSERERAAMETERAANKYKQVEYLKDYVGNEFEAVISGVAAFGFWAETVEHKCEGLISISNLNDYDDFKLVEADYMLIGLRTGRKFRMGDKITIQVVAANLTKRQLDFNWVLKGVTDKLNPNSKIKKGNKKRL